MSIFTITYFSKSIPGCTQVNVILPIGTEYEDLIEPGEKFQTLWLLHGAGGNFSEWSRYTSIERLAMHHKFAVVMPDGGTKSGYNNMVGPYNQIYTYILEELPAFLRKHFPLSDKREDNFIAGLSMGARGAAMLGFSNPDKYSAIGMLSNAPGPLEKMYPRLTPEQIALRERYVHGPLEQLMGTPNDLLYTFRELKNSPHPMPLIYNACGTEDFLYPTFRAFQEFTAEIGMEDAVIFEEQEGGIHNWDFWDTYIARFVDLLPLKNRDYWRKWYDSQQSKGK